MDRIPHLVSPRPHADGELHRLVLGFRSARSGFEAWLRATCITPRRTVVLPSYVGWSAREGSGVFDPVCAVGLPYAFYRVVDRLEIDLESLRATLQEVGPAALLLIHYFGRPDPHYHQAIAVAREAGALVLEDEAHAMLSDVVGGITGRLGDAAIYSLHKLLPVEFGGALVLRSPPVAPIADEDASQVSLLCGSDVATIARRRIENATSLAERLTRLADDFEPLWTDWPPGAVPQTFPVLVRRVSRDALYQLLNSRGIGVVSLYHTLIGEISAAAFPEAVRVSRTIMNLPVHQGLRPGEMSVLVDALEAAVLALDRGH